MDHAGGDFRNALRSLARARGFSATVVGTLALAIALEALGLALVNAYLVRSLPYPAADRLYNVGYARPGAAPPSGLADLDWTAVSAVVEHPISWDLDMFYLIGGQHPEAAPGAWVTPGFMRGLGIRAAFGRTFTPDEFQPGAPQVALISHALWQSRFGGDSAAVGGSRSFEAYVSDRPDDPEIFTIVGVLPPAFWHLNPYTSVLTPLRARSYPYIARLREGVPVAMAEQRITDLARDGGKAPDASWRVELRPVQSVYSTRVKPLLLAIVISVSTVLLIACANVAVLVLLRGMRRQREIAVRIALGAGRARLARLLLTESLLLTVAGVLAGGALAVIGMRALAPAIERQLGRPVPGGTAALSLDITVLVVLAGLALLIAAALTLAPLLTTSRQAVFAIMRRGRQGGVDSARGRRMRSSLIALEIAGSLALVVGAGLMVGTVRRMLDVEMGLEPAGIITGNLGLRERTYPDSTALAAFYERLLRALGETPGVAGAALSYPPPLAELDPRPVRTDDPAGSVAGRAGVFTVTPDFFAVLGIALLDGRAFTPLDRGGSEPVALVSETAARRLWPGGGAVGRRIRAGDTTVARMVVGVVRDVRHSPTDDEAADVYLPLLQSPGRFARLVMRAPGELDAWAARVRGALREIDPEVPFSTVRRLDDYAREQLARPRFLASVFAGFGLFATALALVGVYGVVAFAVRQREHEIAVRMAVGADRGAIIRLFLRDGTRILAAGLAAGALGAIATGRVLESQVFGVPAVDPRTIVTASLGLAGACLAAIWWPARRASGIDPVIALREE